MRPEQIFNQLAESGMTLRQAVEFTDRYRQVSKRAGVLDKIVDTLSNASAPIVRAAFIAPPALGYLAGDMLARGMDADSSNVADIQEQELVSELRANAAALRRRQQLRESQA